MNLHDTAIFHGAWRRICHHIDGIALSTTVDALVSAQVLSKIPAAPRKASIQSLAEACDIPAGCLQIGLRLLALQGWLEWHPSAEHPPWVSWSKTGIQWLAHAPRYARATERLSSAGRLLRALRGKDSPDLPMWSPMGPRPTERHRGVEALVQAHHDGPLVAAALWGLGSISGPSPWNGPLRPETQAQALACHIMEHAGWLTPHTRGYLLNQGGRAAMALREQYAMALAYLPLLERVGNLFTRTRVHGGEPDASLNRALDIEASGTVFARHCREPLAEVLRTVSQHPPHAYPKMVMDTGCGDGRMLEAAYITLQRGAVEREQPLLAIGVDPSPVSRRATERRLARAGIPHIVLAGDIGDPDAIAARLKAQDLDMTQALHLCKSAIHERGYRGCNVPRESIRTRTEAVFMDAEGNPIPALALLEDLTGWFQRWKPWIRDHGLIAIEAHCLPTATTSRLVGSSTLTLLEATHGYSRQYLVEAPCHRAAAEAAGLRSQARKDLIVLGGYPLLSLDYWMPTHPH